MGSSQEGYIMRFNPKAWGYRQDPETYFNRRAKEDGTLNPYDEEAGPLHLVDFHKLINDFELAIIGGRARDLFSRPDFDDDTMSVFFVGSETWGDSPDGYGYIVISTVVEYGLEDYFCLD